MKGRLWSHDEDALLRNTYSDKPTKDIAAQIGISYKAVARRAYALGLCKSEAYLKSDLGRRISKMNALGVGHRFKKGQEAHNKGVKVSEETYAKCAKTFFKQGDKPHNTGYDGKISVRGAKTKNPYYYIRISEKNWQPLHRHTWEQAHGAIPERCNVQFIDGDWQNCTLSNLRLMTKKENITQNNISNLSEEVKEAIWLVQGFNRKINTKIKKRHGNKKHSD